MYSKLFSFSPRRYVFPQKYLNLIKEMIRNYRCVKFVNLSMSCSLGVFSDECSTFLDIMNDIGIDKKQQLYIIKKMINIAIRATCYIFCCRNGNWHSPDFSFLFFSFFFLSFFLFFFFFGIIQSQEAFVNCLYIARFTIVHSKTQIKFPLLLLLFLTSWIFIPLFITRYYVTPQLKSNNVSCVTSTTAVRHNLLEPV